jgi:hypothetical protein
MYCTEFPKLLFAVYSAFVHSVRKIRLIFFLIGTVECGVDLGPLGKTATTGDYDYGEIV